MLWTAAIYCLLTITDKEHSIHTGNEGCFDESERDRRYPDDADLWRAVGRQVLNETPRPLGRAGPSRALGGYPWHGPLEE